MTTLTIDVDHDIMDRAKAKAAAQNTTVEHIVEKSITDLAGEQMNQTEIVAALEAWSRAHPFRVDFESFTREELNER